MEDQPEVVEQEPSQTESVDPSHELDLETVFEAQGAEGEMEALAVHSMLVSSGIDAVLSGSSTLPNLPFAVQVPHDRAEEALRVIAEAEEGGAAAADEAAGATLDPAQNG